jgi:hypothetical protein
MEERPPIWGRGDGSCEYIEQAVAYSRQGVVRQLGVWVRGYKLLTMKTKLCYEIFTEKASTWTDTLVRTKQRKRDMNLVPEKVGRVGSLTAAARELAIYKLDLVGVQELKWVKEGAVRAGDCKFFMGK